MTRPARRETRRAVYESEVGRFRYSHLRQSLFDAYNGTAADQGLKADAAPPSPTSTALPRPA